MHLDNGVGGAKDSLYNFKVGCSWQTHDWLSLRLITEPEIYHQLVELRAKSLNIEVEKLLSSNFFPAYRY